MSTKLEPYKGKDDDDGEFDLPELQSANNVVWEPVTIPSGHHKLQYQYWIWFSKLKTKLITDYDQTLKLIGCFGSVEQFWALYGHLIRPSELPNYSEYHLFKIGIKPMWEDENNRNGGCWKLRMKKGLVSRCWENLILAVLGEQFMVGDEICGCVVSIRMKDDFITVWNKTASDSAITARIGDTLRRVLNLPPSTEMTYSRHKVVS